MAPREAHGVTRHAAGTALCPSHGSGRDCRAASALVRLVGPDCPHPAVGRDSGEACPMGAALVLWG